MTGERVLSVLEPSFYDSSAEANHTQYPHIFIRLIKSREDITTGRKLPSYGQDSTFCYKTNATKAFQIITQYVDGTVDVVGNIFSTSYLKTSLVQPGHLLRILQGTNKGTYTITAVSLNVPGPHTITVSNTIVVDLPEFTYDSTLRKLYFDNADLNTIKVTDEFVDSLAATFAITAIDIEENSLTIDGITDPDVNEGASINRIGNVFTSTTLIGTPYLIMDPTKPIIKNNAQVTSTAVGFSPQIPIDMFYLIRIDSKERANHIDILNRVWEEFNPPRTGLPVVIRTKDSAEQLLAADVTSGGSNTITVSSNLDFKFGDPIFIFDDLTPTKSDYAFQEPFKSKIVDKISTNQIVLADVVPDTYIVRNSAKIVSNPQFKILMFHFVDHQTKDVEGAQYWVHEFTFWVQGWIDRLETPREIDGLVLDISTPMYSLEDDIILLDR